MDNQQVVDISGYREIPFATDYLISTDGKIFSKKNNKHLKTSIVTGYYRVWLRGTDSTYKQYLVHRVVAMTYIPNPDNKEQVNHIDGVKTNNSVNNLEWVSRQENMVHAFATGLNSNKGEDNGKARLTESQVLEIYDHCLAGKSNKEIAKIYEINVNHVNLIRGKHSWGYLLADKPVATTKSYSKKLTQQQKDKAKSLRESGMTSKAVSELMGITLNQAESVTRSKRK